MECLKKDRLLYQKDSYQYVQFSYFTIMCHQTNKTIEEIYSTAISKVETIV